MRPGIGFASWMVDEAILCGNANSVREISGSCHHVQTSEAVWNKEQLRFCCSARNKSETRSLWDWKECVPTSGFASWMLDEAILCGKENSVREISGSCHHVQKQAVWNQRAVRFCCSARNRNERLDRYEICKECVPTSGFASWMLDEAILCGKENSVREISGSCHHVQKQAVWNKAAVRFCCSARNKNETRSLWDLVKKCVPTSGFASWMLDEAILCGKENSVREISGSCHHVQKQAVETKSSQILLFCTQIKVRLDRYEIWKNVFPPVDSLLGC